LKQVAVSNSDAGASAVVITGAGAGNSHGVVINSTNGHGISAGSTNGNGLYLDSVNGDPLNAAPVAQIQNGLATQASVNTIDDLLDTEIAAIKGKTDNLPADPASNTQVNTRLAAAGYTAPDNAGIAAIQAKTDNLPAAPAAAGDIPSADANADALLDRAAGVETNWTVRQALRVILAAVAGKLSGATTNTVTIKNPADSKSRIVATVDADGNRSAVTYDKT
jgi:hypothetical protein